MCLVTLDPTIKTAARPIVCYKSGRVRGNTLSSEYFEFEYERYKKTPHVKLSPIGEIYGECIVFHGYHSYNSILTASSRQVCIIPKGTQYIDGYPNSAGGTRNRVSSSIIWVGSIWKLSTWHKVVLYRLGIRK